MGEVVKLHKDKIMQNKYLKYALSEDKKINLSKMK